jgi:transcriptional regulator with XRE-family HTH domain
MSDSQRTELAAFLRARRAQVTPQDAGLPEDMEPGRRRTPGLRREEVAELAGMSLTWYTWLEQGRRIAASPQVIDALARALLLEPGQHRYLRRLAGLADLIEHLPTRAVDRAQRLVDSLMPNVASVYDGHFDFVAWNLAYARIRTDPAELPQDRRNLLWWMFTDHHNRWWQEYSVNEFRPATIGLSHPTAGELDLQLYQLRMVEDPDLLLVLQLPATDEDRGRIAATLDRPSPPPR